MADWENRSSRSSTFRGVPGGISPSEEERLKLVGRGGNGGTSDQSILELPQVFSRTVGPIPPVSVFQGYNPQTMAQVEGPQQGGWVPLMQDPITMGALGGGGAAVAGVPGMFAQLAQMYGPQMVPSAAPIGQPSVMGGYRPGWQKIPNTTEPQLPNWPTMPELSGPKGMGPIGGPATGEFGAATRAYPESLENWRPTKTRRMTPAENSETTGRSFASKGASLTPDQIRDMVKEGLKDWKPTQIPVQISLPPEYPRGVTRPIGQMVRPGGTMRPYTFSPVTRELPDLFSGME